MSHHCSTLESLVDRIEGQVVPLGLREKIETHLNECRTCRAGMNNFHKVSEILQNTVYGERDTDEYLAYISGVAGRKLRWESVGESRERSRRIRKTLILKLLAGLVVAVGLGVSAMLILGYLGWIGPEQEAADNVRTGAPQLNPNLPGSKPVITHGLVSVADSDAARLELMDTEQGPLNIFSRLNITADSSGAAPAKRDSSRLHVLQAELSALRDALSRTPDDYELRRRAMEKYREVIEQRRKLNRPPGVAEYYGLGYLHYAAAEYPQTAVVTDEGLRMVRMGPRQYLHYLKAMSHYQIAIRAASPLPLDTTAGDTAAIIQGAAMRARLDQEGKRRAVMELRKAITEFSHLFQNPELEDTAREWVLKCNELIEELSG